MQTYHHLPKMILCNFNKTQTTCDEVKIDARKCQGNLLVGPTQAVQNITPGQRRHANPTCISFSMEFVHSGSSQSFSPMELAWLELRVLMWVLADLGAATYLEPPRIVVGGCSFSLYLNTTYACNIITTRLINHYLFRFWWCSLGLGSGGWHTSHVSGSGVVGGGGGDLCAVRCCHVLGAPLYYSQWLLLSTVLATHRKHQHLWQKHHNCLQFTNSALKYKYWAWTNCMITKKDKTIV
jgi:hypothetical protein